MNEALRWLRYFAGKATTSVRHTPVVQLVSVTTIAVSVMVLGVVLTLVLNVDALADRWASDVRIVAFLADDAEEETLEAAAEQIRSWPEVLEVQTRARERALSELRAELGDDAPLLDGLDPALVPASVEVALKADQRSLAVQGAVAARLRGQAALGEVESVDYGQDIVARLHALADLLRLGGLVVGLLVAFAVVFIISNTVRLGLYARREELEIMQLVGATDRFIRAPFYLEGAFQGLAGALAGVLLLWAVYRLGVPAGQQAIQLDLLQIPLAFPGPATLAGLVSASTGVGVLASHLSTSRFLRGRGEAL